MKNGRYSDSQIMAVLKQAEGGTPVSELCREHGMSSASFYIWRAKLGGMDASLMSEMSMQNDLLKEALEKSAEAISEARDGHECGRTARGQHCAGLPCV